MVKEKLSLKPGFSVEFRVITKTVGRQTRVKFELSLVSTAYKHKSPPSDVTTRNGCRTLYGRRVLATFLTLVFPGLKPSHRIVFELADQTVLNFRPKIQLERFL